MIIVVDTNIIIAALIKNSISRKILLDKEINFICPEESLIEIKNHKAEIQEKAILSDEEFEIILSIIFENITIISKEEYIQLIPETISLIDDKKDVPFLALAIAKKADYIWSEDEHFIKQNKVKILKTKDLLFF